MKLNPSQIDLDYEAYRLNNGSRALQTVLFSGKSFVVKQDMPEKVVLVGVEDHAELEVSVADFERNSIWFMLDEMALYFGTKEQQADTQASHNAVYEAMRLCVYGAAKTPLVV